MVQVAGAAADRVSRLPAVQPLKNSKNLFSIFFFKANAVIFKNNVMIFFLRIKL